MKKQVKFKIKIILFTYFLEPNRNKKKANFFKF